jgi:glycosyltransferase involved in cell wall biosynthesis
MPKIIALIPCYNEEKNVKAVVQNITERAFKYPIDYLVINDCSVDSTLKICQENGFNYLDLSVNLGIGGGMQAGYMYACQQGYDIAIQHDGDGQHDPCCFETVIAPIVAGDADIVIGSRFMAGEGYKATGWRRLGISFLSGLIHLCTGIKIHDVTSGYRAVNRRYIEFFAEHYAQDYPEPEAIMDAALNKAKILEIPVVMHERKEGKSSINALGSLYYMIKVSVAIFMHRATATRKG